MNYAVLIKLNLTKVELNELTEQVKISVRQHKLYNLAEITFYRSSQNPQEVYVLSFWFQLEDSLEARKLVTAGLSKNVFGESRLLERKVFRLHWEYRLVTQVPVASHIRLLTFPVGYPEDKAEAIMQAPRVRRPEIPGLVGSWIGRGIDEPRLTLQRADWASPEDMQNFFKAKKSQDIIAARQAEGIEIEYASLNMEGFIEHLPDTLNQDKFSRRRVALFKE